MIAPKPAATELNVTSGNRPAGYRVRNLGAQLREAQAIILLQLRELEARATELNRQRWLRVPRELLTTKEREELYGNTRG